MDSLPSELPGKSSKPNAKFWNLKLIKGLFTRQSWGNEKSEPYHFKGRWVGIFMGAEYKELKGTGQGDWRQEKRWGNHCFVQVHLSYMLFYGIHVQKMVALVWSVDGVFGFLLGKKKNKKTKKPSTVHLCRPTWKFHGFDWFGLGKPRSMIWKKQNLKNYCYSDLYVRRVI